MKEDQAAHEETPVEVEQKLIGEASSKMDDAVGNYSTKEQIDSYVARVVHQSVQDETVLTPDTVFSNISSATAQGDNNVVSESPTIDESLTTSEDLHESSGVSKNQNEEQNFEMNIDSSREAIRTGSSNVCQEEIKQQIPEQQDGIPNDDDNKTIVQGSIISDNCDEFSSKAGLEDSDFQSAHEAMLQFSETTPSLNEAVQEPTDSDSIVNTLVSEESAAVAGDTSMDGINIPEIMKEDTFSDLQSKDMIPTNQEVLVEKDSVTEGQEKSEENYGETLDQTVDENESSQTQDVENVIEESERNFVNDADQELQSESVDYHSTETQERYDSCGNSEEKLRDVSLENPSLNVSSDIVSEMHQDLHSTEKGINSQQDNMEQLPSVSETHTEGHSDTLMDEASEIRTEIPTVIESQSGSADEEVDEVVGEVGKDSETSIINASVNTDSVVEHSASESTEHENLDTKDIVSEEIQKEPVDVLEKISENEKMNHGSNFETTAKVEELDKSSEHVGSNVSNFIDTKADTGNESDSSVMSTASQRSQTRRKTKRLTGSSILTARKPKT